MGITAHWIQCKTPKTWLLCHKVIAFKIVVGLHTGENLARYFITLCKQAGILNSGNPKASVYVLAHLQEHYHNS